MATKRFTAIMILLCCCAILGVAAPLMYHFGPFKRGDMDRCRIFDVNGDRCSWQFSNAGPSLLYEGNNNPANDYIFLPPVEIADTGTYLLTLQAVRGGAPEILEVGFTQIAAPAAFTSSTTFSEQLTESDYTLLNAKWHCTRPGSYYPALRVASAAGGTTLRLRHITLSTPQEGAYTLPLHLPPTPPQALHFAVLDRDSDNISWQYDADSLCFATRAAFAPLSDDWLLLPAVKTVAGHYAVEFDCCAATPGSTESIEVRFGPVGQQPEQWPILLTHPAISNVWQRISATAEADADTCVLRYAAIRLTTPRSKGIYARNFSITTAQALPSVPFTLNLAANYSGTGDEWIFLPPFMPESYRDLSVAWQVRANGPHSPQIELWEGVVADTTLMRRISSGGGVTNRLPRPMATTFYNDRPHGQHIVALRIRGGNESSGGVIETVEIDTVPRVLTAAQIPVQLATDTTINGCTLLNPIWLTNMDQALAIDVYADSHCTLLWGDAPDPTSMQPLPTDTLLPYRHIAVPKSYGKHWLATTPTGTGTMHIDSICIRPYGYGVTVPQRPTVRAAALIQREPAALVSVDLPRRNIAGMEMWDDEILAIRAISECDTLMRYATAGSSISFPIKMPQGTGSVKVSAANYAGEGPAADCSLYTGIDTPLPPTHIYALPDADNKGARLHWHTDTKGVHGTFVDTDSLHFTLQYATNAGWHNAGSCIGTDSGELRLPDDMPLSATRLRVVCANNIGTACSDSAVLMLGTPLSIPLEENFSHGTPSLPCWCNNPGSAESTDPSWPDNGNLLMNDDNATLLLPSFATDKDVLLTLRLSTAPSAPALRVDALVAHRKINIKSINTNAPDGRTDILLLLPDSLTRLGAISLMLSRTDSTDIPTIISRYAIDTLHTRAMLMSWNRIPEQLRIGEDNIVQAQISNAGTEPLVIVAPKLLYDYKNNYQYGLISPDAPLLDTVAPAGHLPLVYTIPASAVDADHYNDVAELSVVMTDKRITALRRVDIGNVPVVLNLAGELLTDPARVFLQWGAPTNFPSIATYTVYRDSTTIASGISDMEFTDTRLSAGTHRYNVVCNHPDAPFSNSFTTYIDPEILSVGTPLSDDVSIIPLPSAIRAVNLQGETLTIHSTQGMLLRCIAITEADCEVSLSPGLYLVQCAGITLKLRIP